MVAGTQVVQWENETKAGQGGLLRVALFWKSQCTTHVRPCVILYHVTGLSKGSIANHGTVSSFSIRIFRLESLYLLILFR